MLGPRAARLTILVAAIISDLLSRAMLRQLSKIVLTGPRIGNHPRVADLRDITISR